MDFNENASLDSGLVRSAGGGGGGGGKMVVGGIGGVIILIISLFLGINPGDILGGDSTTQDQSQSTTTDGSDPMAECTTVAAIQQNQNCRFTAYATAINAYWSKAMKGYTPVQTELFSGSHATGCGTASAQTGPFYCPVDKEIWLDAGFFQQLQSQFGAEGGPAAELYVLAHETGHHVQDLMGTLDQVQSAGNQTGPTSPSVRLELQADCYGGVAMKHVTDDPNGPIKNLTQDDINRAMDAAKAVGDDRIQQRATGQVDRESWTHGSSANRQYWLGVGFSTGDPNQCTTFAANAPQIG